MDVTSNNSNLLFEQQAANNSRVDKNVRMLIEKRIASKHSGTNDWSRTERRHEAFLGLYSAAAALENLVDFGLVDPASHNLSAFHTYPEIMGAFSNRLFGLDQVQATYSPQIRGALAQKGLDTKCIHVDKPDRRESWYGV